MWMKRFKDYPFDSTLKKEKVEPGKGIVGCEMHEMNGWGESKHIYKRKKRTGLIYTLLAKLFGESTS